MKKAPWEIKEVVGKTIGSIEQVAKDRGISMWEIQPDLATESFRQSLELSGIQAVRLKNYHASEFFYPRTNENANYRPIHEMVGVEDDIGVTHYFDPAYLGIFRVVGLDEVTSSLIRFEPRMRLGKVLAFNQRTLGEVAVEFDSVCQALGNKVRLLSLVLTAGENPFPDYLPHELTSEFVRLYDPEKYEVFSPKQETSDNVLEFAEAVLSLVTAKVA